MAGPGAHRWPVALAATLAAGCGGGSDPPRPGAATATAAPSATARAVEHIEIRSPRAGAAVRAAGGFAGPPRARLRLRGTASPDATVLLSGGCDFKGCDSIARAGAGGGWRGRVWVRARTGGRTAAVEASTSASAATLARLRVRLLPAARRASTRAPEPAAAPQPLPQSAGVRRLVLVGDSLAQGIEPLLPALLPGWEVLADAERSRTLAAGMAIATGLDASAPTALAISLFTNDDPADVGGLEAAVRASVERVGPDGCAIWATIVRPPLGGVSYDAANARLMELQRTPAFAGRLRIVPWAQQVARHPEWIAGDGVHATPDGYRARARMYAGAALGCGA